VEILVQPFLAELDYATLNNLGKDISREFENIKVTVATSNNSNLIQLEKDIGFQSSFDKHRNQWYSPRLLDWCFKKFRPNKYTKCFSGEVFCK
jgi:archaemetzincin